MNKQDMNSRQETDSIASEASPEFWVKNQFVLAALKQASINVE